MSSFQTIIATELNEAATLLAKFLSEPAHLQKIEEASKAIVESVKGGGKVISCGKRASKGNSCDLYF